MNDSKTISPAGRVRRDLASGLAFKRYIVTNDAWYAQSATIGWAQHKITAEMYLRSNPARAVPTASGSSTGASSAASLFGLRSSMMGGPHSAPPTSPTSWPSSRASAPSALPTSRCRWMPLDGWTARSGLAHE